MAKNDTSKETIESLEKQVTDKREALRIFRFEGAGSRRRNVREARTLRREIARLMTDITAKKKAGVAETKKTK